MMMMMTEQMLNDATRLSAVDDAQTPVINSENQKESSLWRTIDWWYSLNLNLNLGLIDSWQNSTREHTRNINGVEIMS